MKGMLLRTATIAGMLTGAAPLLADVKAGVDAWSHGDYATAIHEWQGPAASGDADAQFNLGQAYKLGRGVKQDLARAEELFGQASAQGHMQASDNFGLLLFQRGEHARAVPYLVSAADRGDPRAQYLLGIAHFNGDNMPKDWVRAYALVTLARQSGLSQANGALQQMDKFIPLDQRQLGTRLAADLAEQTAANRARQLAAADLGTPPAPAASPAASVSAQPAKPKSPREAGADFTTPRPAPAAPANRAPIQTQPPAAEVAARPEAQVSAASTPVAVAKPAGAWRVQLGAFGIPANAEALWSRVRGRPELVGHDRLIVPAGKVSKLQAGGFASQGEAQAACARLEASGFACLPVRN